MSLPNNAYGGHFAVFCRGVTQIYFTRIIQDYHIYIQTFNISDALVGNKIVDQ